MPATHSKTKYLTCFTMVTSAQRHILRIECSDPTLMLWTGPHGR